MSRETIFSGSARVYLQGKDALQPFENDNTNEQAYYIGSQETNLIVRDHRSAPNLAASEALMGQGIETFPDSFNVPANVEISTRNQIVEIELSEPSGDDGNVILWLGVSHDGRLPIHYLTWHTFVLADNGSVAFAAVVED